MPHRHPERPDRQCICNNPPQPNHTGETVSTNIRALADAMEHLQDKPIEQPDPIMARVRAAYGTLMQAETETGPDHSETYNDRIITKALAYLDEAISAPLPPAPVEYRWGIQTHSAPPRASNLQWICSPCLANRTIGQPSVTVVSVIHADPVYPYPTCADCETRYAPSERGDAINQANAPHRPPPDDLPPRHAPIDGPPRRAPSDTP